MKSWELEDVEEAARESTTFLIPEEQERTTLQVGQLARLHFVLLDPGPDDPRAERMWVEVTSCAEAKCPMVRVDTN